MIAVRDDSIVNIGTGIILMGSRAITRIMSTIRDGKNGFNHHIHREMFPLIDCSPQRCLNIPQKAVLCYTGQRAVIV